jgi:hypothetical protein
MFRAYDSRPAASLPTIPRSAVARSQRSQVNRGGLKFSLLEVEDMLSDLPQLALQGDADQQASCLRSACWNATMFGFEEFRSSQVMVTGVRRSAS